jgi:hypothetical protein
LIEPDAFSEFGSHDCTSTLCAMANVSFLAWAKTGDIPTQTAPASTFVVKAFMEYVPLLTSRGDGCFAP